MHIYVCIYVFWTMLYIKLYKKLICFETTIHHHCLLDYNELHIAQFSPATAQGNSRGPHPLAPGIGLAAATAVTAAMHARNPWSDDRTSTAGRSPRNERLASTPRGIDVGMAWFISHPGICHQGWAMVIFFLLDNGEISRIISWMFISHQGLHKDHSWWFHRSQAGL